MTISRFLQEQTHTRGSAINDGLTPADHDANAKDLGETLDYMCSQLADITGKTGWELAPDASIATLAGRTSHILWGADSVGATTRTRYLWPGYHDGLAELLAIGFEVPRDGLLRKLRIRHNTTAGNGNGITYTVEVNGVPTAIAATFPSTSSSGFDLINTFPVFAGNVLALRVTKTLNVGASPRNIVASLELV